MDLGGAIKQCRSIKKLTLAQLSDSCGISTSHLCLIEKNKREPSLSAVEAIAQSLGLSLSGLIFLAEQRDKESTMEFWTSLIKTSDDSEFLNNNCTHVVNDYWIYEGDEGCLDDELSEHEIIASGAVPNLGGLTTQELTDGCRAWFGVAFTISTIKVR